MERMSPLDASFLAIEDAVNHMHIGSVGIFDGPAPGLDEVRELIGSKLGLIPRYRQKARTAPASIGRPVWIDDPHFNLENHLGRRELAAPGGKVELRRLVGLLMSQQLDRAGPLWETWVVDGIGDGRWGMVTKVHHCMVDGIAGTDLLAVVLDRDSQPAAVTAGEWRPEPEPSALRLGLHSLRTLAAAPVEWGRGLAGAARHPATTLRRARDVTAGIGAMTGLLRPAPASSLTGPIGPRRSWDYSRAALADVKEIRAKLGGTVNDVVLSAVTRGLRDLLVSRGEPVWGRTIRSLVPVSLRTVDPGGQFGNKVAGLFAELPVGVDDPVERLVAVRAEMEALKSSHEAEASEAITAFAGFGPPVLTALATRIGVHNQRSVETVTTNVPGPQFPLYFLGRRMLEAYPYVPVSGTIRVGVAIWSYDGWLHFGVTGDSDAAPDVSVLCTGIEDGIEELHKLAAG